MSRQFVAVSLVAGLALLVAPATTSAQVPGEVAFQDLLPLEDFSPTILGVYRKVMQVEDEIRVQTERYGLDYELARAVCMYESGGNADLTSWAGAKGYFQVMPATYRSLGVGTNIEAGVKYLAQLVRRFEREDYALAAYNGGPTNVGRGRAMRLESLQYVLGVGYYRTMLKLHERSIRHHAAALQLTTVGTDEDWWGLSRRLGFSLLDLRLHNPYLARRDLRAGEVIAYSATPREPLFVADGTELQYTTRLGDNYFNIAFPLDVDLDALRQRNGLWHLQTLQAGVTLQIPLEWEADYSVHQVQPGETLEQIAATLKTEPWRVIRDNALFWGQAVADGMTLRVRKLPEKPKFVVHRVSRGENLTMIARRYRTSVGTIQGVNNMGRRTMIRIGERLRIPMVAE